MTGSLLVDTSPWLLISRGVLANSDICYRPIHVDLARTDYIIPSNILANRAKHPYNIATALLKASRQGWSECLNEALHFSNLVTVP